MRNPRAGGPPGPGARLCQGLWIEAKTDPLDAQVPARYGEVVPEADTREPATDLHRQELKDLLRPHQFVDERVPEPGRLDQGISATIAKSTKRHIAWLENQWRR